MVLVGAVLTKCKLAPEPMQEEPVWVKALSLDRRVLERRDDTELNVQVFVRMKNGDLYIGDLRSYPILPDSEEAKDIRLGNSVLYLNDKRDSPVDLRFDDYKGGGVLLNTVNVSSIEYVLHEDYQSVDESDGSHTISS